MTGAAPPEPLKRRTPPPRDGLTAGQAAELERIQARYGRVRSCRYGADRLLVAIDGDHPAPGARPVLLLLDERGRVVGRVRPSLNEMAPAALHRSGAPTHTRGPLA